jgi:hypothetical protein
MPAFKPFAGPSPSCEAVLVHIEHCAWLPTVTKAKNTVIANLLTHFFIPVYCLAKIV